MAPDLQPGMPALFPVAPGLRAVGMDFVSGAREEAVSGAQLIAESLKAQVRGQGRPASRISMARRQGQLPPAQRGWREANVRCRTHPESRCCSPGADGKCLPCRSAGRRGAPPQSPVREPRPGAAWPFPPCPWASVRWRPRAALSSLSVSFGFLGACRLPSSRSLFHQAKVTALCGCTCRSFMCLLRHLYNYQNSLFSLNFEWCWTANGLDKRLFVWPVTHENVVHL